MLPNLQLGERYWKLIEPYWGSISIYDGSEIFLAQFRSAPQGIGDLYAAHWCQSEVCNGGLHQFFGNSTGLLAPEALTAFRAMGLVEWADILAEAISFFGKSFPREQADRLLRLNEIPGNKREEWDPFYYLDNRFYNWLHAETNRWECAADEYANSIDNESSRKVGADM